MANSFTCPMCGLTSYNPNDVENSYCGNCHLWFEGSLPIIRLNETDWNWLMELLESPPKANPRLQQLLSEKKPDSLTE